MCFVKFIERQVPNIFCHHYVWNTGSRKGCVLSTFLEHRVSKRLICIHFATPGLKTAVFCTMFATPGLEKAMFCDVFGTPGLEKAVFCDVFGTPGLSSLGSSVG